MYIISMYNIGITNSMNNEESTILNNDCKYKVVFLGDSSVGKTSLVEFIMYGSSNGNQQPTLCLESTKKMVMHKNQIYKLMLWDTAGQEKFNSLIPSFVRGCDCAVIVFDVANKQSLDNCQRWLNMVKNGANQHEPAVVLVANKTDLTRVVTPNQGFQLAIKHKLAYVQSSAKTGKGLEQLVAEIVENIEKNKFKSEKQTKSSEGELNSSRKLEASKVTVSKPSTEVTLKTHKNCCAI